MLKIENLKKTYEKVSTLDGLNMNIGKGSLCGFVGPNGTRETTTIKVITGLLFPSSGTMTVNGVDAIREPGKPKGSIGYVPNFFGIYNNLEVSEYMEFFVSCYGLDGLKARRWYMGLLEQVGLDEKVDFYVDRLSRGVKQKLCLVWAFIHDPSLLIMDRPTFGLDLRTRYESKRTLRELREQGKTVLINSHILSGLSEICMDTGVIERGKVVLEGNMEEMLSRINISSPLIISIFGGREAIMTILRSHLLVEMITVREGDIVVGFTGDKRGKTDLLAQLVDADVLVYGFVRERGNLESILTRITDREEDEVVPIHED